MPGANATRQANHSETQMYFIGMFGKKAPGLPL